MKGIALIALLMMACDAETTDITEEFKLPPELSGCKVYRLESIKDRLFIVKCGDTAPATGTTTGSKHPVTTVVIDGRHYAPVEAQ